MTWRTKMNTCSKETKEKKTVKNQKELKKSLVNQNFVSKYSWNQKIYCTKLNK